MIVLSFLLVVIAAVALLVGLFQDTLTWIWTSIGACVLAMVFLGIGVLQRRSSRREPDEAAAGAYGPGAIGSVVPGGDEEEPEEAPAPADDVSVVPKRSVSEARGVITRAEIEEAADEAVAEAEAKAEATEEPVAAGPPAKKAAKEAAKKTGKKTAKKKATKKAAKKTTKKTAKKAGKKAAAKKTTGKAARERLDQIKGLGPAKQKALLDEFGSLEAIRDADVADLKQVKGIGDATAQQIQGELS